MIVFRVESGRIAGDRRARTPFPAAECPCGGIRAGRPAAIEPGHAEPDHSPPSRIHTWLPMTSHYAARSTIHAATNRACCSRPRAHGHPEQTGRATGKETMIQDVL